MATGYKVMSVPDRIQLSTGPEDATKHSQYRPMKVPDTITLSGSSDEIPPSHMTGRGGSKILPTSTIHEEQSSLEEIPYSSVQTSELQYRLESLEERVKRLEEGGMSRAFSSSSGPGRFWYALTFSSWMMVPLIVVFLMYYKRQN